MPEMEYTPDDLRTGGTHADSASQSAEQAAGTLTGAGGGGSPYGDVHGAADLHGAVGHAQQHHAVSARDTSTDLHSAASRARLTAALGDDNTEETTRLAPRSAQAGTVANGM